MLTDVPDRLYSLMKDVSNRLVFPQQNYVLWKSSLFLSWKLARVSVYLLYFPWKLIGGITFGEYLSDWYMGFLIEWNWKRKRKGQEKRMEEGMKWERGWKKRKWINWESEVKRKKWIERKNKNKIKTSRKKCAGKWKGKMINDDWQKKKTENERKLKMKVKTKK